MPLAPGTVYIAPGDFHLEVVRSGAAVVTRLTPAPPENFCRPAVDVLFRSVARVYGAQRARRRADRHGPRRPAAAREVLRVAGAEIVAQDEATSVVWGMPGAVVAAPASPTPSCRCDQIANHLLRVTAGRGRPVRGGDPMS